MGRPLSELFAHVAAVQAEIERIASGEPRPLSFRCAHGGTILVTRCASEPGKWRATRIDEDGEPSGHSARDTFADAVRAAYDRGAAIEPNPEPVP